MPSPFTLLFLHIPKTAGTSLSLALARKFPQLALYHIRSAAQDQAPKFGPRFGPEEEFRALDARQRRRFRCVLGHFQFGLHEAIPGPARYFTLFRDPLERYVSQVAQYNRMAASGELGPEARPVSLAEFRRQRPAQFRNPQTRWLLGLTEAQMARRPADDLVTQAQRHLDEHFAAVGVVERMDDSLRALAHACGWESLHVGRDNASTVRPSIDEFSPAEREEFEASNQLDRELWRSAAARLDAAVHELEIPSFALGARRIVQGVQQLLARRRAA